jgi:hypothetical protein
MQHSWAAKTRLASHKLRRFNGGNPTRRGGEQEAAKLSIPTMMVSLTHYGTVAYNMYGGAPMAHPRKRAHSLNCTEISRTYRHDPQSTDGRVKQCSELKRFKYYSSHKAGISYFIPWVAYWFVP